ncbi:hypothetical protein AB4Z38_18670 [Arthrobacter sp. 2RAF6]|uniref:S10 family serine carboxypeptidase-like protein n=1 Tax=Arthrobacter sp. 2RAF6 TaxID=3233002 RepID=UPI003F914515
MPHVITSVKPLAEPLSETIGDLHVDIIVERWTLRGPSGAAADAVTTTYKRAGTDASPRRPVIFAFNGGPGSSSGFLGSGLLAPFRIDLPSPTEPPVHGPFRLVPNTEHLLETADVVLVDPPGTGLTRVPEDARADFLGVTQDADAALAIIRSWCSRQDRDGSPLYLLGESYGSVRVATILSRSLGGPTIGGEMHGTAFSGAILIGGAFDLSGRMSGDTRFISSFPTMAATAWFHGAIEKIGSLPEHVASASKFAREELVPLYDRGRRLDEQEKTKAAHVMSSFIGLPAAWIAAHDLRVEPSEYTGQVLAERGLQAGAYDSRFAAPPRTGTPPFSPPADPVADDSAMGRYTQSFAWASRELLRRAGVTDLADYRIIDFANVNGQWDWGHGPGTWLPNDPADSLRRVVDLDSDFRMLFASGVYDFVTPVESAQIAADHISYDPSQVVVRQYESGHMPYIGDEPRKALSADIRTFLNAQ